jgi:O-methyltransferase
MWFLKRVWYVTTVPVSIVFILSSRRINPAYRLSLLRKLRLGLRMFYNKSRLETGTSFKTHLAMALKILETPPEVQGVVMECGTWKGGTAANLSLVCKLTGRKLLVYDSFEGLPVGTPGDREAGNYEPGDYSGSLEEVRRNVARYGAIDCCEFIQGWFDQTLPNLSLPVLLAYLDVDYEASLDVCVREIWPRLVDQGYIFTDECAGTDYVALFYSERWWREHFDRTPPGLIGAGSGLALGEFYIGPWSEYDDHPAQHFTTGAYTRKDMSGYWSYYPDN